MGGVLSIVSNFSIRTLQELFGYPQKSFEFASKSKEQLVLEYNGLNAVSAKYFYIQLLSEIKNSVLNDDEESFKTLDSLLNYVTAHNSSGVMQKYEQIALEAVGKINLITFACKTGARKILGYLLTEQNVNFVLPFRANQSDLSPEEEDEESHNAFYYAIRSKETSLLETLINKLQNSYFKDPQKLDDVLSKAFNELSVRNVPLTKDMEIYVKKKLVDLRFFHKSQKKPPTNAEDLRMIRIEFLLEKIDFVLKNYWDNKNELDEQFLLAAKFIVQNIHTVKSQLYFTYDKVPWEEMEFCLIIFLRYCLKVSQFEPFYYFVLNKQRLLSHLKHFSKRLEEVKEELKTVGNNKVPNKIPHGISRTQVIEKKENKLFEDLYKDFTQIRDLFTLEKIKKYTNIALSVYPRSKEGQIVITRALQVTGEHLNNTSTAPKLSDSASDFLLSVLPNNLSDVIKSLRNSLSHLQAFCLRSEIEENADIFFFNIQADISKVNSAISDILYKKKITVIMTLLSRMVNHESIDSWKIIVDQNHTSMSSFKTALDEAKQMNLGEIGQLEKLVANLEAEFDKEASFSKKMFLRLQDIIEAKPIKILEQSLDVSDVLFDSLAASDKEMMNTVKTVLLNTDPTSLLIEHDYFVKNGKIDIDTVNQTMAQIFIRNNVTKNKAILNRIKAKDVTITSRFFPQCDFLLLELPNEKEMAELIKPDKIRMLRKLVLDVVAVLEKKLQDEKEQIHKIQSMIADKKNILQKAYEELNETLENSLQMIDIKDDYNSSRKLMRDIFDFHKQLESLMNQIDLKSFSDDLYLICNSISSRMDFKYGVGSDALNKALLDIFDFVFFRMGKIKWIEEFKHMIHIHKEVKPYTFAKNVYTLKPDFAQQLTRKISLLESVLKNHNLESLSGQKLQACYKNMELQTLVEMLVLDILSVIEGLKKQLTHVNFYLDSYYPTAYGRNLRNHIAHGNALVDMILGENFTNIVLNAQKIIEVKDILKEKLGKIVENDPVKSKKSHENDLAIMIKQKEFFVALAKGNDEKGVEDFISEGVDIYGRDLNSRTALHFAAMAPNPDILKSLRKFNLDVNSKDDNHQTALHVAANFGREGTVEYLIEEMKMLVDCKDVNGETPLHIASKKGHEGVVRLLLKYKANGLIKEVFGYAPLHYAVLENHDKVVTAILENETEVDANQSIYGFTALHLASAMGHLNIIDTLLEKGADVNFKSDMDYVPLHSAATGGHSAVVKFLLKRGANVNAQNAQGFTPLHSAVEIGDVETVGILLQHGAEVNATNLKGFTPFYIAAGDGNLAVSKLLIEEGATVAKSSGNVVSPLEVAANFGHCELVKELLNGADVNSKILAMKRAASKGHTTVVELILNHGIDVMARSIHVNSTALHFAAEEGHTDTVKFLLNRGADINSQDGNGETALHLSSRKERKEVVKLLIEMKADILIKDNTGTIPLEIIIKKRMTEFLIQKEVTFEFSYANNLYPFHYAAYCGDVNFVSYCIKKGCNVDIRNESGLTALHMATHGGHEEVINFLLKNGCNITAKDKEGRTAVCLAVRKNNNKILELLIKNGAIRSTEQERSLFLPAVLLGHETIVDVFLSRDSNVMAAGFKDGEYPLHMAVTLGHISVVKRMLEQIKKDELNIMDQSFITPLLLAIGKDDCEIAQMLLSKGADPDISSKEGTFPLLIAIARRNSKMVEILLNSDADYLVKDAKGKTSIQLAIETRQGNIVDVLLQKLNIRNIKCQDDRTLLHIAAYSGSLEIVKSLIEKKADINSMDSSGAKPIHTAAKEGYLDILEYFLNLGIAADDRGENGWTLMHYAASGNHSKVCKFLFEKGADINAVNKDGATPLHIAAKMGKLDALLALLELGAFYDARDKNDETPLEKTRYSFTHIKIYLIFASNLFSAVKSNSRIILVGLLKASLDILKFNFVNVKDSKNTATIHYAAWKGYERIVNILLRYRANPNLRTKHGWTSLHYAAKYSHYEIVKDLLCNGAVFEATSDSGKTPLHFSTNTDIITILEFLKKIFLKIENKDHSCMEDLKTIKDMDIAKSVLRAKNLQYRSLTSIAIINDNPDINELKELFQTDVFIPLKMAEMFHRHGNVEESLNLYQVVLLKRMSIFGQDDPAVLNIQKQIASLLIYYGDYNRGLSLAQSVHKILESTLGDRKRETLIVKCLMAFALESKGQEQKALKIYEEVYEKQREVFGLYHEDTLATRTRVAELLYKENKLEMALKANEEILKTLKNDYEINFWTFMVQTNIATILRRQEKFPEALKEFRKISVAKEKIFGLHHQETLETSTEIAVTLLHMNEDEESLKLFRKNAELQLKLLGPKHPHTLRSRSGIADILYSQRRFREALDIYEEDFNERISKLGADHPSLVEIRKRIESLRVILTKTVVLI